MPLPALGRGCRHSGTSAGALAGRSARQPLIEEEPGAAVDQLERRGCAEHVLPLMAKRLAQGGRRRIELATGVGPRRGRVSRRRSRR